ncbi:MAG: hypothetical protein OEN02_08240 [Gammaproteobacteria bacterium]|nr:hypothetical protein [Gammaproteobacteria bacterium]
MLWKQFGLCLVVIFSLLHTSAASAIILSFDPSDQTVQLGNPVSVDLRISDLGDDILTGFDLDISFDDSILGFQSFTFGTGLDVFGLGFNFTDVMDLGGGVVNVFELSLDFDLDLMLFQPDDFVLGTFDFSTLSLGTSALDISFALLSGEYDAFGFATELHADLRAGSVTVSVIPVPAAVWLFGTGLVGLIGFGKRRKVIQQ